MFVVNNEGKVEFVSDQVKKFIHYSRDEVEGKSIYNIIHHGDHQRFSSKLSPLGTWDREPQLAPGKAYQCRLLVKPPDDQDETMEEKQQRVSKYENMQIISQLVSSWHNRDHESSDSGQCLLCVARRIPQGDKNIVTSGDVFTIRFDTSGKILEVDTLNINNTYQVHINKVSLFLVLVFYSAILLILNLILMFLFLQSIKGRSLEDICHPEDLGRLQGHLKECVTSGTSQKLGYRFRKCSSNQERYWLVQVESRMFKKSGTNEPDFINSCHNILG